MKVIIIFKLILSVIILFSFSCSPSQIFIISTSDSNFDFYQGKQLVAKDNGKIKVQLNFEGQENGYFTFYSYFKNLGEDKILINPTDLQMVTNTSRKLNALNPESEIHKLIEEKKKLDESHSMGSCLNCLSGSFSVAASVVEGDHEAASETIDDMTEQMKSDNENYEYKSELLMEAKLFWQNEMLRITHLYPGDEIGGLIQFPIDFDATSFRVVIAAGDEEMYFDFSQIPI